MRTDRQTDTTKLIVALFFMFVSIHSLSVCTLDNDSNSVKLCQPRKSVYSCLSFSAAVTHGTRGENHESQGHQSLAKVFSINLTAEDSVYDP